MVLGRIHFLNVFFTTQVLNEDISPIAYWKVGGKRRRQQLKLAAFRFMLERLFCSPSGCHCSLASNMIYVGPLSSNEKGKQKRYTFEWELLKINTMKVVYWTCSDYKVGIKMFTFHMLKVYRQPLFLVIWSLKFLNLLMLMYMCNESLSSDFQKINFIDIFFHTNVVNMFLHGQDNTFCHLH